jgi:hypothetical protein
MTETLILSGFYAFAGFGLPSDFREMITIPAKGKKHVTRRQRAGAFAVTPGEPERSKVQLMITEVVALIGARMKSPGASRAVDDQNNVGSWESRAPGGECSGSGNEGVGEHVRTRFHFGSGGPVKLRSSRDPHRTKKTSFFCRTGFRRSA